MVKTVKGKVAEVEEDIRNGSVWVTAENTISGNKEQDCFDMVVLATGMQPSLASQPLPLNMEVDEEGFVLSAETNGIFAAGCAAEPLDVMKSAESATSAAMKAIQTVRGR
jgi:quinone-modifying oxidoreductase subunit QmoA